MKKHIMAIIVIVILILAVTSCGVISNTTAPGSNANKNLSNENDSTELLTELLTDIIIDGTTDEIIESYDGEVLSGGDRCPIHIPEYHIFPHNYTYYVGENKFFEWINGIERYDYDKNGKLIYHDGCRVPNGNIYEFIKYFNISKEEFYDLWYYSSSYYFNDHNPDILFSDDMDLIEEYYRRDYDEHEQTMSVRTSEYLLILEFMELYYDDPIYGEAFREVFSLGYNRFSIPQLIYVTDITHEEVEELYERVERNSPLGCYDYDFDTIYTQKEAIQEAMRTKTPEEINDMVRSVDGVPCSDWLAQNAGR